MWSAREDPKYQSPKGLFGYAKRFIRIVDFISIFPYWVGILTVSETGPGVFLLLKILHFEKHSKAFTTFDDVLRENMDVLAVTGFSAVLLWIFFASILYYTERNSLDDEISFVLQYHSQRDVDHSAQSIWRVPTGSLLKRWKGDRWYHRPLCHCRLWSAHRYIGRRLRGACDEQISKTRPTKLQRLICPLRVGLA